MSKQVTIDVDYRDYHENTAYNLIGAIVVNGVKQGLSYTDIFLMIQPYVNSIADDLADDLAEGCTEGPAIGDVESIRLAEMINFTDMENYDPDVNEEHCECSDDEDDYVEDDQEDEPF